MVNPKLPKHGQSIVRVADLVTVVTPDGVPLLTSDPLLEIPRGNILGVTSVNKYGRSTNVDNGVDTDVWDRANAVDDQDIWVAPTTERIHQIVSSSASDIRCDTAHEVYCVGIITADLFVLIDPDRLQYLCGSQNARDSA